MSINNKDFFALGRSYLESNAYGMWDGARKADSHARLCELFVSKRLALEVLSVAPYLKVEGEYLVSLVRKATLPLTDYLDEVIGFPLERAPNYKRLVPEFVGKFLQLANDWMDEQTGLMSDSELKVILDMITRNHMGHQYPSLESYGFEFVDGEGTKPLAGGEDKCFLTMQSLLGQVVTIKPNTFFGCSYTIDKGLND